MTATSPQGTWTRLTPALREKYIASGAWQDVTFYHYLELRAREHPDRVVFIDANRSITYGELKDEIDRCATFCAASESARATW